MPHAPHEPKEPKVKSPKFMVFTTDGNEQTTLHGTTNDPGKARVLHIDNPGSVVTKGGHLTSEFDRPERAPKEPHKPK